jgi:hypothetical protein
MPVIDELMDQVGQIITSDPDAELWFTKLDLNYAFSQLPLKHKAT